MFVREEFSGTFFLASDIQYTSMRLSDTYTQTDETF